MLSPVQFLREAIKAVPAVKYALGIGGIVAAIAIIYSFKLDPRIAVIGTVLMLFLMTMLVVFARVASLASPRLLPPAMVMTWFSLLLFIAVSGTLFSSIFFREPLDLSCWLRGDCGGPSLPVGKDLIRLNIDGVTIGQKEPTPYIYAAMSLGKIGDGTLLINTATLTLQATSRTNGHILYRSFNLAQDKTLVKDGVLPIRLDEPVAGWGRMGAATDELPSFSEYFMRFVINVQATEPGTGKHIWFDIEAPAPAYMTCGHPCVAVYSISAAAGETPYKKCAIAPAGGNWQVNCATGAAPL